MSTLIASLLELVESFSPCFRKEVFETFKQLLCGWLMCNGRRTISHVWETTGLSGKAHHSRAFRLLEKAKWDWDPIGAILIQLILERLLDSGSLELTVALDDTVCPKRGGKVAFGSMQRDPCLSSKRRKVFRFGHNWVVLGIVVKLPFCMRPFCLPVLWRLVRKKGTRGYKPKTQLAAELFTKLARIAPQYSIFAVADSAYACKRVLTSLPANVFMIGGLPPQATLYDPSQKRKEVSKHAPLCTGVALPKLAQLWTQKKGWQKLRFLTKKGTKRLRIKILKNVLWYGSAKMRMLTVILIRDEEGKWRDEVLFCTDPQLSPSKMISTYLLRWSVELVFADCKQQLGCNGPMVRTALSVQRAAPLAFFVNSLVVIWYARVGYRLKIRRRSRPWYQHKRSPTFSDMLATCRFQHWNAFIPQGALRAPWGSKFYWLKNYISCATYA